LKKKDLWFVGKSARGNSMSTRTIGRVGENGEQCKVSRVEEGGVLSTEGVSVVVVVRTAVIVSQSTVLSGIVVRSAVTGNVSAIVGNGSIISLVDGVEVVNSVSFRMDSQRVVLTVDMSGGSLPVSSTVGVVSSVCCVVVARNSAIPVMSTIVRN
jgi:hypothetical protein